MARLAIALLGPLRGMLDEQPITSFSYDKVRALLVYLLIEVDYPHHRDSLAALLWPDASKGTARKSLRNALTTLRQALGDVQATTPVLHVTRDTVQRNPAAEIDLDVTRFNALLTSVSHHAHPHGTLCADCVVRLAEATALYRGNFVQHLTVPESIAWEEWVLIQGERLHQEMIEALTQLVAHHEAHREHEQARQYAWRTLALESWNEAAHRCLMRIFARTGQRNAALAQYERCRNVLNDELGIEPAAETTTLYKHIRTGTWIARDKASPPVSDTNASLNGNSDAHDIITTPSEAPSTLPPTNLPVPPTPLIGRAADIAALCTRIRQSSVPVMTIIGSPGIGKTRLALEVAGAVRESFADGVWFVALAPVHELLVAPAIAQTLGLKDTLDRPLIEVLTSYLREKHLLLLLDNFEHLLGAAPLVADLAAACPHLIILVTSRAALHIRAERLFRIAALDLPDPARVTDLNVVGQSAAVRLFVERAQATTPHFVLTKDNAKEVASLCIRLEGIPLALELAAARVQLLSPSMLLAQLNDRLAVLTNGPRDLPERQQALRAAIGWSYKLLSVGEQRLFARLGVFAGGYTFAAAAAVCDPHADLLYSPLDGLTTLVRHSLVQCNTSIDGVSRFTMLESIREYALEQMHVRGETKITQQLHAQFYLQLAEQIEPELRGAQQEHYVKQLEVEHSNLQIALQWTIKTHNGMLALRLGAALWRFWYIRNYLSEGCHYLEHVLAISEIAAGQIDQTRITEPANSDPLANVLYGLAVLRYTQGHYASAIALLEESLRVWRKREDRLGIALALNTLGRIAREQEMYARAIELFTESLALMRELQESWWTVVVLFNLGLATKQHGHTQRAAQLFEESLALGRVVQNRSLVALSLKEIALITLEQGDVDRAMEVCCEGLEVCRELEDTEISIWLLERWAIIATVQGQLIHAVHVLGLAETQRQIIGAPLPPADRSFLAQSVATLRTQLDSKTFAAAWATGRTMTIMEAITQALALTDNSVSIEVEALHAYHSVS